MPNLIVRPIERKEARRYCELHPHARTLPNTSKYYMAAYIGNRFAGLAVWGYGIMPRHTPRHLFGNASSIRDYLELSRFFVLDWCPKYTAGQFLAFTHRIIKRYAPWIKWLYTYAAGFQGMIGTIYQATNYDYIGKVLCNSFIYVPDKGLIHSIPLWLRYGFISGSNNGSLAKFKNYIPDSRRWCGYNFRYIYWLCDKREKRRLMDAAKFEILPYPKADEIQIWLEDVDGSRENLSIEFAKSVSIVKLPTRRKGMRT